MKELDLSKLTANELLELAVKLKANNDVAEKINQYGEQVAQMASNGDYDEEVLNEVHAALMDVNIDMLDKETLTLYSSIFEGLAGIRNMIKHFKS